MSARDGRTSLLDVAGRMYDAATGDGSWEEAARACVDATSSDAVLFAATDLAQRDFPLAAWVGRPVSHWHDYLARWIDHDPHVDAMQAVGPGQVVSTHEIMDSATLGRLDYHRHFLRPIDLLWSSYSIADAAAGQLSAVCCHRASSRGPFTPAENAGLQQLGRHLKKALEIGRLAGAARTRTPFHEALLARLDLGILFVDRHGRIVEMNARARAMLGQKDGLQVRNRRLSVRDPAGSARLGQQLQQALREASPGRDLQIGRPSGRRPWIVGVSPVFAGGLSRMAPAIGSLVTITDPEDGFDPPEDRLRALHGLTAAQARVARVLCAGDNLVEAADRLGITHETARQHMKQILAKTDCRRQTDLIRLLLAERAFDHGG